MSVTIDVFQAMLCGLILFLGFIGGVIFVTATSDVVRNLIYGWMDRRVDDQAAQRKGGWPSE